MATLGAVIEPETMQTITSACALVAAAGAVSFVAARAVAGGVPAVARFGALATRHRNWLTFVVALAATSGSLYFSEVAHYVPCRLCWFQRVCMYPITAVALVGALRGDRHARCYVLPLAVVGLGISSYHYLIEWKPSLDTGSCTLFGPACTDIWFRSFGFVTLAFMALCGFVAIIVVNLIEFASVGFRTTEPTPQPQEAP